MSPRFDSITLEDVAHFPRPGTSVPARIGFSPDGKKLTYLASAEGNLVLSLFARDVDGSEPHVIAGPPPASEDEGALSREEELRRERARLREVGVTSYHFAPEAETPTILIPSGGALRVCFDYGEPQEIPGTRGALDARLSPDGSRVAFVRDGELYVADVPAGNPRQLTHDAEDGLTNGVADFIAAEELGRPDGYWWSPDGTKIAFVRADSRHIPEYPIVHQGGSRVDVERHRYPFAGEANAVVELGVVDVETGETTWMDLGPDRDIYLARVAWRPGNTLTAQVLSRDQSTLHLRAFNSDGSHVTLLKEESYPWFNLHDDLRFLDEGGFLWSSERTGYRHLYHYADGGDPRQLTSGEWSVTRVVRVDQDNRTVYFEATRESPLERHLYRVSLDGGEIERLTGADGVHTTVVSPVADNFIDVHSTLHHPPVVTLRALAGNQQTVIFANEGASAAALGLQPPAFMEFEAHDGTQLHGAFYPPLGDDGTPPVIVAVYGGPHVQRVVNDWSLTVDLRAQFLARRGYGVLKVDNRGSANRGLAFEAHIHRRMGTVEIDDQAAAVRQLAARGAVDGERAGIYGASYGGYVTCLALMRAPGMFKAGVAVAPVTDWDGYDTGYTERYMGTPADNPDGYREASVLNHAASLEGHLMLVHGGIDENVHFRHTARLLSAFIEAQKDADLLIFPQERHMPRDHNGLIYQERRLVQFFDERL